MKKYRKVLILVSLMLAAVTLLCSCGAPNTVSTDTKYKLALVTSLYPDAGGAENYKKAEFALSDKTVSGCAWKALNQYRKSTYDSTTSDKLAAIKYYTPAEAKGTDTVSYAAAFTAAAKKQLELAQAGGAEMIVVSGEDYTNAYLEVKDDTKKFGEITFVLLTVPGSKAASAAALNPKTTAVVFDNTQFGYLFGYYAAEKGFKKIGYTGADGTASESFINGLKAGAEAGGGAEVLTQLTSSGPVENIIKEDLDKISGADILIGDELTMSYVAASGKKYASIYSDEKAEFYVTVNAEALSAKLADIINTARQSNTSAVKQLSAEDGIFVYSGSDTLVDAPRTELPNVAADTAAESDTTAVTQ